MDFDYNFTEEEKVILYREIKNIINSDSYKLLIREYVKLVDQISKKIASYNLDDSFAISRLLKKDIDQKFISNDFLNCNYGLDLDILYKLWGSRVFTGSFSNRHVVSFINDILIRCGYVSCEILTKKEKKTIPLNLNRNDILLFNNVLLCLIINNKKVFYDVECNKLLEFNNILSNTRYNCYQSILNRDGIKYYVKNYCEGNLEVNGDHLFTLNSYIFADEFDKSDYNEKNYVMDYLKYVESLSVDLIDINNLKVIASLNEELSQQQNNVYKRIKKI